MREQSLDQTEEEQKVQNDVPVSTESEEDEIRRSIKILVKVLIAVEQEYQRRTNNKTT